jgi:hypothetical protein
VSYLSTTAAGTWRSQCWGLSWDISRYMSRVAQLQAWCVCEAVVMCLVVLQYTSTTARCEAARTTGLARGWLGVDVAMERSTVALLYSSHSILLMGPNVYGSCIRDFSLFAVTKAQLFHSPSTQARAKSPSQADLHATHSLSALHLLYQKASQTPTTLRLANTKAGKKTAGQVPGSSCISRYPSVHHKVPFS